MTGEDRDELFALADKASLNQKSSYRFAHLEDLLSAELHLAKYSEDERAALHAEFQSLSEEDQQMINANLTTKSSVGCFHLLPDETDKIKAGRKKLPLHERARLSSVRAASAGTAWLDLGGILDARIEIDDHSSAERRIRPYARIYFCDDEGSYPKDLGPGVITVDILESVRRNAVCIGNPVIVLAIQHWQEVLQARKVFEQDSIYDVKIAKKNLEAVGKALVQAPKANAISKEAAFFINVERLRLKESLHVAWERLHSDHIDQTDEPEVRRAKIVKYLKSHANASDVFVNAIENFLKGDGERFLYNDESEHSQRGQWRVFRNRFLASYYGRPLSTIREYLGEGVKTNINPNTIPTPSFGRPQGDAWAVLFHVLTSPLVSVHETAEADQSERLSTDLTLQAAGK